ncbi:C40 family peptidase [Citrobacter freundii]|nr:C40 family peptidase [Citrobacter freundii]EJB8474385.1 C40 family peptidase [Citrobacter freundii]EJB8561681.1 C40 family peptidase [Citrobacter freundii]MBA8032405.1 C40 family peptidase [Citrobacter freundii]QLO02911.1 C40 family peptidase [Citrobacter freundii]QLU65528.1 C40 family peptidase [Citrobacter freundii]
MSFATAPRRLLPGLLSLCVVLSLPCIAKVQPVLSNSPLNYAAQLRMRNRARLLKQYHVQVKKQASYVVEGNAESKKALRQQNRVQIKRHPEWFPGPLKASDHRWQELAENPHFLSSDHLRNITEVAIHRLEQQLGKPYLWGGTRPDEGFDCSGLVFYAYNKILAAKLPRTANEMYHYRRATIVSNRDLRRGDLLFFHIHSRDIADHMGVYLGQGQFIESPRTGETIRVSTLSEPFWQDHYLGARRILTENTIL